MRKTRLETPQCVIAYLSQEKLPCDYCDKKYIKLGLHLKLVHGVEVNEYREKIGLPSCYGLSPQWHREIIADNAKQLHEEGRGNTLKIRDYVKNKPKQKVKRRMTKSWLVQQKEKSLKSIDLARKYRTREGGIRKTKLSFQQALDIKKRLVLHEGLSDLAREYGVSVSTIWRIKHGK